eukprot:TRINITY_DN112352_c0_g1_i1.p1 TRINITY_DN112352_c0_g1~~TRINITY_DN112352_c0_g1_i1.p1  ORF type:complete len:370 (-),score=71.15 TRINITY_DN112352_c0_g1_i1:101-1210(-)
MSSIVVSKPGNATGPMAPLAPILTYSSTQVQISPWLDAKQDEKGRWQLPEYPCEVRGLAPDDPKNSKWRPGSYIEGVDNVDYDKNNVMREWGGQKMWEGQRPPREWNPERLPESMQELLKVPHMPGQPMKEMFARMKALQPKLFEDRFYSEIRRDLPKVWPHLLRRIRWAESFGLNTEAEPAEWSGQEELLVPAVYLTPRPDTVTICVGRASPSSQSIASLHRPEVAPGVEYDYCELLYAKDQEGKLIQVMPWESCGITPAIFWTFSFVPPKGTTSITPYASFKFRGVWKGDAIEWDPEQGSEDMMWFTNMDAEQRRQLADPALLEGAGKAQVEAIKLPKRVKEVPVLWPENSYQANVAKARAWEETQK